MQWDAFQAKSEAMAKVWPGGRSRDTVSMYDSRGCRVVVRIQLADLLTVVECEDTQNHQLMMDSMDYSLYCLCDNSLKSL